MRKLSFFVAAVFFVSLFLANSCQSPSSVDEPLAPNTAKSSSSGKSGNVGATGILRLLLTDAPAEEAENIFVTVGVISVHKEGGAFFTVSEEGQEQQFDLKALEGQLTILLSTPLEAGNYTQIRLQFVQGLDEEDNFKSRIVFGGASYPLEVPSGELKIPVNFEISGNETTEITFDFDAAESIHIVKKPKKDDTYILRPVIHVVNMQSSGS
jgi:hypothetical protein